MALKCFIAMAFDRTDTDALYNKVIEPLLEHKGITPFRVDRSNRNDDIDDQILAELAKCNFVIADLTYTRPSVYFEAGVAQGRPVEVIYTCRRDHFKHRADDLHGNYRVHFDLQMKPIIKWDDPPSASFARQLAKRISHVLRPIVAKQRREEQTRLQANELAVLSFGEKKELFKQTWTKALRSTGFRHGSEKDWPSRKVSDRIHVVRGHIINKLTRKELQAAESWLGIILPHQLRERVGLGEGVTVHLFYVSLAKISRRMIEEALPNYRVKALRGELSASGAESIAVNEGKSFRYRGGFTLADAQNGLRARVVFHVISGAASQPELRQTLKHALEAIG